MSKTMQIQEEIKGKWREIMKAIHLKYEGKEKVSESIVGIELKENTIQITKIKENKFIFGKNFVLVSQIFDLQKQKVYHLERSLFSSRYSFQAMKEYSVYSYLEDEKIKYLKTIIDFPYVFTKFAMMKFHKIGIEELKSKYNELLKVAQ